MFVYLQASVFVDINWTRLICTKTAWLSRPLDDFDFLSLQSLTLFEFLSLLLHTVPVIYISMQWPVSTREGTSPQISTNRRKQSVRYRKLPHQSISIVAQWANHYLDNFLSLKFKYLDFLSFYLLVTQTLRCTFKVVIDIVSVIKCEDSRSLATPSNSGRGPASPSSQFQPHMQLLFSSQKSLLFSCLCDN